MESKSHEPVRGTALITSLVLSILNVACAALKVDPVLAGGLNLVGINAAAAYGFFVLREQVTPNQHVALTKTDEMKLIEAGVQPPPMPQV